MAPIDIVKAKERFTSGHRACAGCPVPIIVKHVLAAAGDNDVVVSTATGCLEVVSTIYPYSSWNIPWIHNTFENAAATISGVEAAYKALKKKGKIKKKFKFIAFGGDGGTYDIGLQSLSGALERGHDFVYVCYDNEGYMNTGNQRSSATPYGAETTTTPYGKVHKGKEQWRKDLTKIAEAHNIPYVAQTTVAFQQDLYMKAKKALETPGPAVLVVLSPCPTLWHFPPNKTLEVSKLAVETNFWPLYEIEDGKLRINYKPKQRLPIIEFMKLQGRFRHVIKEKDIIDYIQKRIDEEWNKLLSREHFDQSKQ